MIWLVSCSSGMTNAVERAARGRIVVVNFMVMVDGRKKESEGLRREVR